MRVALRLVRRIAIGWALLASVGAARAAPETLDQSICRMIEASARANRLPVGFLTRVIWRESSFRTGAVSPVGAEGVAQFMPGTARERDLADPFDPEQAIPKAARLLADLDRRYGNLGDAAAAYNAGAGRVDAWRQGRAALPAVTQAYVSAVTAGSPSGDDAETCLGLVAELRRPDAGGDVAQQILAPWGVQLAGNFSKQLALAAFYRVRGRYAATIGDVRPMIIGRLLRSRGTRVFYQIRIPAPTRAEAEAQCRRILALGGACGVLRS